MHPVVTLAGEGEIPVRTIFCIGRNYAAHAREMGNTAGETPVVFIKPVSALIREGEPIRLPAMSRDVHHEAEICLLLGSGGRDIAPADASAHILGVGVGLDLTMRDVQRAAREGGLPWTIAKGFDTSAAVSSFVPAGMLPDPAAIRFTLDVNGTRRQTGDSALMLFPPSAIISYLSSIFTLERGDLIFTGTPEGVGKIASGDLLDLRLGEILSATFTVA